MQVKTRALLKIGLLTNLFEWYEFSIYGYLAGFLGHLFFNATQPALTALFGFLPFTVSYLMRPIGALVLGYISDSIARQWALNLSLFMMSVPTALIGLLPIYDQIGSFAPVCLVILRLIQGFGAGGERPIMGCYLFENAEMNKKGLLSSTVTIGGLFGFLSGSLTTTLLNWYFSQAVILKWAWRIPFLLGIPMAAYIFYVRQSILVFSNSINKPKPSLSLLMQHKAQLFNIILLSGFAATCAYSLNTWMPTYLSTFIEIPQKVASLMNTVTLGAMVLLWGAAGYLSDLVNYKKLTLFSILSITLSILPLFKAFQTQSYGLLIVSQLVYALLLSGVDAPLILYAGNSFPEAIRSLGMSLGLTLGATVGGLTPLLLTWLIYYTGSLIAPAFYILVFGVLTLSVSLRN